MTSTFRVVAAALLAAFFLTGDGVAQDVKLRPMRPIYVDSLGAAIRSPEGVAFDGGSRLVVADTWNRRLIRFDVTKESISPVSEFRLNEVPLPVCVGLAPNGEILALDGKSHRVARISADGSFLEYVEIAAAEGSRAAFVKSFDVDDEGNLYVLEVAGSRILVIDAGGNLRRTIAFGTEAEFLADLAVSSTGAVFAVDSVGRRVFVARKGDEALEPLTERMSGDMAFPTAIDADDEGYLYISDSGGSGIVVLGENGSFQGRHSSRGRSQGFLWKPAGLAAHGDYLFVADQGNNRVQVFLITR